MDSILLASALQPTTKTPSVRIRRLFECEKHLEAGGYHRSVSPEDFRLIEKACAVAREAKVGLLLSGATGCGKTLALRCLVPQSELFPRQCLWIDFYNPVQIGWLEDMSIIKGLKVLVLDDVGAEAEENDYGIRKFTIVDFIMKLERLSESGQPIPRLFVTTNLSSDEMSDRYGDRMVSRLLSLVEPVTMTGDDYRSLRRATKKPTSD